MSVHFCCNMQGWTLYHNWINFGYYPVISALEKYEKQGTCGNETGYCILFCSGTPGAQKVFGRVQRHSQAMVYRMSEKISTIQPEKPLHFPQAPI